MKLRKTYLLVKSDGIVLDNLKENVTDEEVRNILALKCPAEDLSDVTIHPLGSSKSKLIKDIKSSILQSIVNKVNKSVIDGTQVHCHLHVPVTPPKPNPETTTAHVEPVKDTLDDVEPAKAKPGDVEPAKATPDDVDPVKPTPDDAEPAKATPDAVDPVKATPDDVEPVKATPDDSIAIGAAEAIAIAKKLSEKQVKPAIPGLPEAERLKNKDRKPRNRARTKKKKNENKKEESIELKSEYFLKNPNPSKNNPKLEDTYNFSEYSDDTDDFEDSLETLDDPKANPFETPLKFKSVFGRDQLHRSLSRKRGHNSPSESETESSRPKSKSRLTSTPRGASSLLASKLPLLKHK